MSSLSLFFGNQSNPSFRPLTLISLVPKRLSKILRKLNPMVEGRAPRGLCAAAAAGMEEDDEREQEEEFIFRRSWSKFFFSSSLPSRGGVRPGNGLKQLRLHFSFFTRFVSLRGGRETQRVGHPEFLLLLDASDVEHPWRRRPGRVRGPGAAEGP